MILGRSGERRVGAFDGLRAIAPNAPNYQLTVPTAMPRYPLPPIFQAVICQSLISNRLIALSLKK